jgi:hypothetical protein
MVSRDDGGIRLNAFGRAFFHVAQDLPALFGEAKARKRGPATPVKPTAR